MELEVTERPTLGLHYSLEVQRILQGRGIRGSLAANAREHGREIAI